MTHEQGLTGDDQPRAPGESVNETAADGREEVSVVEEAKDGGSMPGKPEPPAKPSSPSTGGGKSETANPGPPPGGPPQQMQAAQPVGAPRPPGGDPRGSFPGEWATAASPTATTPAGGATARCTAAANANGGESPASQPASCAGARGNPGACCSARTRGHGDISEWCRGGRETARQEEEGENSRPGEENPEPAPETGVDCIRPVERLLPAGRAGRWVVPE